MKKLKHHKTRNVGLIFEILLRKVVTEAINKQKPYATEIIKKFFGQNSELIREYGVYRELLETSESEIGNADRFLESIKESYKSGINFDKVKKERYKLVGHIKEVYGLEEFFKTPIPNYRLLASSYKFLNYDEKDNPKDYLNSQVVLKENIISKSNKVEDSGSEISKIVKSADKATRKLMLEHLFDRFNQYYSTLSSKQQKLIMEYLQSGDNANKLREYVAKEVDYIDGKLESLSNRIVDRRKLIKIDEVRQLLHTIKERPFVTEDVILSLMNYYELIEYLKKDN